MKFGVQKQFFEHHTKLADNAVDSKHTRRLQAQVSNTLLSHCGETISYSAQLNFGQTSGDTTNV